MVFNSADESDSGKPVGRYSYKLIDIIYPFFETLMMGNRGNLPKAQFCRNGILRVSVKAFNCNRLAFYEILENEAIKLVEYQDYEISGTVINGLKNKKNLSRFELLV